MNYARFYSRNPWAAPAISMDNVIRVIVGHRPFRPHEFRIESERFDDKTVIHNYGHGGGTSLAWGSSALAGNHIYTRDVARHTTSNVAAGEWSPFSVHDPGRIV